MKTLSLLIVYLSVHLTQDGVLRYTPMFLLDLEHRLLPGALILMRLHHNLKFSPSKILRKQVIFTQVNENTKLKFCVLGTMSRHHRIESIFVFIYRNSFYFSEHLVSISEMV